MRRMNNVVSSTESTLQLKYLARLSWFHWIVIAGSLLLTFIVWYITSQQMQEKSILRFNREAERVVEQVRERMEKYEDALYSGAAAINSQTHGMDYLEWRRFARTLRLETRYPGTNGIGAIYYVPKDELPNFLAQERELRPDFQIHPTREVAEEYWPITYIEPQELNEEAVGLDMAHETHRHKAALRARETKSSQITAPITLVQDEERTPGFLFFAPFYEWDEQNRRPGGEFRGLVYAPFIAKKLMYGVLEEDQRYVNISIRDGRTILFNELNEVHQSYDPDAHYKRELSLYMYGREWVFDIESNLRFRSESRHYEPTIILISGILIDVLLLAMFLYMSRASDQAYQLAGLREEELGKSELLRRAYIEASGDAFWDWHIQDDYEYISPRFWEMLGYDPAEKKHHPSEWHKLIFEEDFKRVEAAFKEHVFSTGDESFDMEVRFRHRDGSTVYMISRGAVVEWDVNGKPVRMIGTHTDVTRQKKIEEELQKVTFFQQLITDKNPDLIFVKDKDFRLVEANPAFMALYPEEMHDKVIGYTTLEAYSEEDRDEFLAEDRKAFKTGYSETYESIVFPNKEIKKLHTQKIRFEGKEGEPYILCIARDVTEREKLLGELQRHTQELEASNKALDDFAYIASHDMKEPLRGIHNHIFFMKEDYEDSLPEEAVKSLDRVIQLSKRMEKLINDLLYYSQLGRTELAYREIPIKEIAEDVVFTLDEKLQSCVKISEDLPTMHCDVTRVTELFRNLITNGLKYNDLPERERVVEVRAITRDDLQEDEYGFAISDNGIGIAPKHHENVFRIFRRLHAKDQYGGGSGSGLSFVKKIVEQHRGRIWIESDEGKGTTFYFTLREHKRDTEN